VLAAGDDRVVALLEVPPAARPSSTCGVEEPAALVQLESGAPTIPNAKMPEVELYEGLQATACLALAEPGQAPAERQPLVHAAVPGRVLLQDLHVAGQGLAFVVRALHPQGRRPGRSADRGRPDRYVHQNIHCDVLVAGGGIAGLARRWRRGAVARG
jgi:sarcosine oxidase subunit alpha